MSLSGYFQDFGTQDASPTDPMDGDTLIEDERLKSFEAGYSAGWEDAVKAQVDAGTHITEDLKQSLADLDFTLNEAVGRVAEILTPALKEVLNKVLPEIAHKTLVSHILEELEDIRTPGEDAETVVRIAPDNAKVLTKLFQTHPELKSRVVADSMMGPTQAILTVSGAEREVDLAALTHQILDAVDTFFASLSEQ